LQAANHVGAQKSIKCTQESATHKCKL